MRIGIVLHPYGEDKPAGLARTIFEFTKGMLEVDEQNEYIIYLKRAPRIAPDLPGKNWQVASLGGGLLWLDKLREAPPADVYIFNTPVMPLFFKPKRSIIIALDYWYILHQAKSFKTWALSRLTFAYHWLSLRRADHIVAISQSTKDDTVRLFGIRPERISVVYAGYKKICNVSEQPLMLSEKFFFFAGIVKDRKNVFRIVQAFHAALPNLPPEYKLAIGGNATGAYADGIRAFIANNGLGERVLWLGHLNDGQMSYAYKRAVALVFPTLLEGFGYPVLEAMDCGIPVITSSRSSLKEVGGEAALLVDPYNVSAIAEAMHKIASDEGLRQRMIERGRAWAQQFSWQKAGREMLCVVQTIVDQT